MVEFHWTKVEAQTWPLPTARLLVLAFASALARTPPAGRVQWIPTGFASQSMASPRRIHHAGRPWSRVYGKLQP